MGDCRTGHEHRSNRRGSELLGQELVHLDGIFISTNRTTLSHPRAWSAGPILSVLRAPVTTRAAKLMFCFFNSSKLRFVGSTPDRETIDDVWEDMNVYQLL